MTFGSGVKVGGCGTTGGGGDFGGFCGGCGCCTGGSSTACGAGVNVIATTTDGIGGSASGGIVVGVGDPPGWGGGGVVVTGSASASFTAPSRPPHPGALTGTASTVKSGSTIETVPVRGEY